MSHRRSRLSIYVEILDSINKQEEIEGKAKITRILFDANLPYARVKEKLDELMKLGLIEVVGGKYYRLTERGKRALMELRKVLRIIEAFGLRV